MLKAAFEKYTSRKLQISTLKLLQTLEQSGYEGYLVGGCVRDLVLGKSPVDIDIATSAHPHQIQQCFSRTIPTGLKHGTVTVIVGGLAFEVTTYRSESEYTDGRRPDQVFFSDTLEEDLSRRDFTINALAYNPLKNEFIDLFNGMTDIDLKQIRTIGNPFDRFFEDGLRTVRACRFSATLNFLIEAKTYQTLCDPDVQKRTGMVAIERFTDEFKKGLSSVNYLKMIDALIDTSLIFKFFQPDHLNTERFASYRALLASSDISSIETKMAILFFSFFSSLNDAEKGARELKLSNEQIRFNQMTAELLQRLDTNRNSIDISLVNRAMSDWKKIYKEKSIEKLLLLERPIKHLFLDRTFDSLMDVLKTRPLIHTDLAVNGNDLANLGIKGKRIGEALNMVLNSMLASPGKIKNDRDTLMKLIRNWNSG